MQEQPTSKVAVELKVPKAQVQRALTGAGIPTRPPTNRRARGQVEACGMFGGAEQPRVAFTAGTRSFLAERAAGPAKAPWA